MTKYKKSSLMACGLKPKECNGLGMKIGGKVSDVVKVSEKCEKCPIYKENNK